MGNYFNEAERKHDITVPENMESNLRISDSLI